MFSPALNRRVFPRTIGKLACALGICSMALIFAVSVGDDSNNRARFHAEAFSFRLARKLGKLRRRFVAYSTSAVADRFSLILLINE